MRRMRIGAVGLVCLLAALSGWAGAAQSPSLNPPANVHASLPSFTSRSVCFEDTNQNEDHYDLARAKAGSPTFSHFGQVSKLPATGRQGCLLDQNLDEFTTYSYQVTAVDRFGNTGTPALLAASPVCGDVNGDGVVSVGDSTNIALYVSTPSICGTGNFRYPFNCDVNHDGQCNMADANMIASCTVGLISCNFTCGNFNCPVPVTTTTSTLVTTTTATTTTATTTTATTSSSTSTSTTTSTSTSTSTTTTTLDTTAPSVPTGLVTSVISCTQVNLQWNASTDAGSGVAGYNVYRGGAKINASLVTGTGYADTSAPQNTTNQYQVSAVDGAGNESTKSGQVAGITAACPDTTPPSTPTGFTATPVACNDVNLAWVASTDNVAVTGYDVYRNPPDPNAILLVTGTGTSVADLTASASTSYSYTVAAFDAAGNRSVKSTAAVAITPACPITTTTSSTTSTSTSSTTTTTIAGIPTPVLAGYLGGLGNPMDIMVVGTRAYLASDTFGETQWDVTNPAAPVFTGVGNKPFFGTKIGVVNNRALVGGMTSATVAHFWVMDVTSTSLPTVLGELTTTVSEANGDGIQNIAMNSAGTMAVVTMGSAGVWVLDLSTPSTPRVLGTFKSPGFTDGVALNAGATIAYVTDYTGGLLVLSLSTPSNPAQIGSFNIGGRYHGVATAGTAVYMAVESGSVYTFDVTTPSSPVFKGSTATNAFAYQMTLGGTQLLVRTASASASADYIDVLSIASPLAPVNTGNANIGGIGTFHGFDLVSSNAYVAAGTSGFKIYAVGSGVPVLTSTTTDDFEGHSVSQVGTRAAVLGKQISTGKVTLKMVDTTTPSRPTLSGTLVTTVTIDPTVNPTVRLTPSGNTAVLTLGSTGIWTVDVTNPATPSHSGTFASTGFADGLAIDSTGNFAYFTDYSAGMVVLNISTPSSPVLYGNFNIGGRYEDVSLNGTTAYVSVQAGSIYVVNITNPAVPAFVKSVALNAFAGKESISGTKLIVRTSSATTNLDYVQAFDVTTAATPTLITTTPIGTLGTVTGLSLEDSVAFISLGPSGIQDFSITTPTNTLRTVAVGATFAVDAHANTAYVADKPAVLDIYTY